MNGPPLLASREDGAGAPLLLLNGGMMSLTAWDPWVPALAARHRLVRCDLRGMLRSPGTPPPTLAGHAEDLVRLLDHRGIARCHVAGTSYGAFVGLHLATLAPARVATLTAMTVADRVSPAMWVEAEEMVVACRAALAGGSREKVYDLVSAFAFSSEWAAAHADEIAARRALVSGLPDSWFAGLAGLLGALERLDVRPLLPRVTCPVLVLLAEHDRAMPRAWGESLVAALPRGELAVVPGCGHGLVVEKPREAIEHVLSFLGRNPLAAGAQEIESGRDGGNP